MNYYEFTAVAVDNDQKLVKGTIKAKNSGNACWQLKARNLLPIRLEEMGGEKYEHAKKLHEARSLKLKLSGKKADREIKDTARTTRPRSNNFRQLIPLILVLAAIIIMSMLSQIN